MTLLSTKLTSPHVAGGLMARPKLVTRYDPQRAPYRLVCVSAPAGYGKSTLLSQWRENVTALNIPSGWVSLDEDDDDPARFLAYLAAALNDIHKGIAEKVEAQLQTGILTSYKPILESFLNELMALPGPHVLFLDDYCPNHEPSSSCNIWRQSQPPPSQFFTQCHIFNSLAWGVVLQTPKISSIAGLWLW